MYVYVYLRMCVSACMCEYVCVCVSVYVYVCVLIVCRSVKAFHQWYTKSVAGYHFDQTPNNKMHHQTHNSNMQL